jgi:prolyl 4-hydroxylase
MRLHSYRCHYFFPVLFSLKSALIFILLTSNITSSIAVEISDIKNTGDGPTYGVDVSYPIHHARIKDTPLQILGDRQSWYDNFMKGCRDKYGSRGGSCDITEADRIAMNLRQPSSMQNYTETGFKKIKCPEKVFKLLKDFFNKNKHKKTPENWNAGNTYVNHWEATTWMVSVEDTSLRGGGSQLKDQIWNAARDTIQEWTGEELTQCSLYGIRIYENGAVLAPHVDRLPLVSSAIVNVDQDVDEPWPLEVYSHDGRAYNVSMEPGEMVLYESHSVIHGRPFPLKGRYYANVFIHFEPVGHSLRHNAGVSTVDVHAKYKADTEQGRGGHEHETGLPPYIKEHSEEANRWRATHPEGWSKVSVDFSFFPLAEVM